MSIQPLRHSDFAIMSLSLAALASLTAAYGCTVLEHWDWYAGRFVVRYLCSLLMSLPWRRRSLPNVKRLFSIKVAFR